MSRDSFSPGVEAEEGAGAGEAETGGGTEGSRHSITQADKPEVEVVGTDWEGGAPEPEVEPLPSEVVGLTWEDGR